VWDSTSGRPLLTLRGHSDAVYNVAFRPDGTHPATASADKTVRVHVLNIEDLMALVRTRVTRSLTAEECRKDPHVEQCPPTP
jgi:WD40 repeat protein